MTDIEVRGKCGRGDFHRHLRPQARPRRTALNLRGMTFCDPMGLVGVAAIAERALRSGERVVVQAPRRLDVARYLARMRLGSVLAAMGAEHDLPDVRERDRQESLLELTRFEGARGAGELAAMIYSTVEPFDIASAAALHDGVSEAGENVVRHAQRRQGFVAAQKWYGGRQLHFAVGDSGVGVGQTLRAFGALDDEQALRLALKRGVTRTPDRSGGVGLSEILRHMSSLGGSLHILSGQAAVTARSNRTYVQRGGIAFQGTLLCGMAQPE